MLSMPGRAVWCLSSLVLMMLVAGQGEPECGACSCKLFTTPPQNLTGLQLNCTATGNDESGVGRKVLTPSINYGNIPVYHVWAYFRRNNVTKVQILNLERISKLYLDENNIDVIFDNAFSNIARTLTELSLTHNKLERIKSRVFEPLKKLKVLDISYNKITELNLNDLNFESLNVLVLSSNQISTIKNNSTKDMSSLRSLDLSHNQLMDISKTCFINLKKLTNLNLSNNKLSNLQYNVFASLPALESLDLSHNSISTLKLFPAQSVKQLMIGHNHVTNLKSLMESFPKLTELHVDANQIQSLNNSDKLEKLLVLNLSGNALGELPGITFPELQVLDLSSNKFVSVPKGLNGNTTPHLQSLTLDSNPLQSVEFSTVGAPFRNLQYLSLCRLDELPALGQHAFPSLIEPSPGYPGLNLTVAQNPQLADVHKAALKDVQPLRELDLSYNTLTSLPMELTSWETISTVNLQGNPWNCQCSLQWMVNEVVGYIYERGDRQLLVDLRCASPADLRGRRLVHFYNWKTAALCGGQQLMGRMKKAHEGDVQVSLSSGSSEGMLIAVSVLGALFILLVIGGVVIHLRNKSRLGARNRRYK